LPNDSAYFSLGYCRLVKTCILTLIALVPLSLVDGADPIKASSVKVEGIIAADNPIVGKTSMPACKDKT
jgi:hypothetical protein